MHDAQHAVGESCQAVHRDDSPIIPSRQGDSGRWPIITVIV